VVLTDNAAITAYLEALQPDPPLLGVTALEKAEVASWNWRAEFEGCSLSPRPCATARRRWRSARCMAL
jgi:glutathione S-transferase